MTEVQPRPRRSPAADEVLIRVVATWICGSDIHGYAGETGRRFPGQVMGHETSGRVEQLGGAVDPEAFPLGALVTFNPVLVGRLQGARVSPRNGVGVMAARLPGPGQVVDVGCVVSTDPVLSGSVDPIAAGSVEPVAAGSDESTTAAGVVDAGASSSSPSSLPEMTASTTAMSSTPTTPAPMMTPRRVIERFRSSLASSS